MSDRANELPKPYHQAVLHWQKHNFPDYPQLTENWEKYFPTDPPFCLCVKLADQGISDVIEVGEHRGDPKAIVPKSLSPEAAHELFGAIQVQASTEFIDRVGKYQLTMQKSSAYKPYAQSMPPMLKEEAFHLAAGVMPLRRWVEKAALGDPLISMEAIQKSVNKWFGRGLEMFGPNWEPYNSGTMNRGLKDRTNATAQQQWIDECAQMLNDLDRRYVRARLPGEPA